MAVLGHMEKQKNIIKKNILAILIIKKIILKFKKREKKKGKHVF